MTLEETLSKVAELSREELSIVRKRGEEKTAAREHGHDFHEMQHAADRLDHLFGLIVGAPDPWTHAVIVEGVVRRRVG